ncbi:MAG: hypothetical protein P9X24_11840 [Candidatus Hatepunaea meridiana]|nr:hypothetical protein [Candidatus Hatepunaea meridiana]
MMKITKISGMRKVWNIYNTADSNLNYPPFPLPDLVVYDES